MLITVIKQPVYLQAIRAVGTPESDREIIDWTRGTKSRAFMDKRVGNDGSTTRQLSINVKGFTRWVEIGDWIIRDADGEFLHLTNTAFSLQYIEIESVT